MKLNLFYQKTMFRKNYFTVVVFFIISFKIFANDGYKLWLQYDYIKNQPLRLEYASATKTLMSLGDSETIKVASKELERGLTGMLGSEYKSASNKNSVVIFGNKSNLSEDITRQLGNAFNEINEEGYIIKSFSLKGKNHIVITGKTDVGVLYGVYNFLKLMQINKSIKKLDVIDAPKINIRILNHWDNLDRTVERGYSGFSIWDWHRLPDYLDTRYEDYARANASIGINGTVLTNVNANALILTPHYLEKVEALANVFRPYGIKVYLTARFSAPIE